MNNIRKIVQDKIAFNNISKSSLPIKEIIHTDDKKLGLYHIKINEIIRIDYPISFKISTKHDVNNAVSMIYKKLGLKDKNYKWLIPYYNRSNWWIRIELLNVNILVDSIGVEFELTAIDILNKFIFDISVDEYGAYEVRLIYL